MPDTVMIFAAGRGTRMGALTDAQPKPMVSVAGKPLLDHALQVVDGSEAISKIVVNTHYLADQIHTHLADRDVLFSHEEELLETGGGLKQALALRNMPELVTLNADATWSGPNPINALLKAWDPSRMDALLLMVPPENAIGHLGKGDFTMAPDGQLTRGPGLVYVGCQIIKSSRVAQVTDDVFSLNVVWDVIRQSSRLFGLSYSGRWCDVGHPGGIELAEQMLGDTHV
ncbi:MobA-like NTP transferase domain-containing protein [Aliiroseovarius halocynthiae]|uniref:Nucleotidyltransferase family protein n=1 Tax=Aliiroseovarius halocynthiae TaxID=985055 RepID=A0A545SNL9_9RHOB|nr:nucleotidyltransferase family protein [Aliiroseovarius halocynthiae]TQV66565.1 nucleotidyltransferase family protein [Aliiroseovarius halocynthiae]SMR82567.1 MobA-like NTP transferase domain-containing protein [Aliiroseovarius halocynthiae]